MLEAVLFYLLSFFLLLSAIAVISSRSAIYSVLALVTAMGFMAGLFVLLKATFVATVLVLVYAGAVLVLFLFVVMLLDFKKELLGWKGSLVSVFLSLFLSGALFWQILRVIQKTPLALTAPRMAGTAQIIGKVLFERYLLPFELTAFLILAAVVSVVVLAKKGVS